MRPFLGRDLVPLNLESRCIGGVVVSRSIRVFHLLARGIRGTLDGNVGRRAFAQHTVVMRPRVSSLNLRRSAMGSTGVEMVARRNDVVRTAQLPTKSIHNCNDDNNLLL